MRELRMLGSVRGVLSNGYPYRDPLGLLTPRSAQANLNNAGSSQARSTVGVDRKLRHFFAEIGAVR